MFNELQIKEIVEPKVEILKKSRNDKKIPEYTEVYKESVDFFERISVHSEIGKFPEKLFKQRAPNQTEEEFEYIKGAFKTTTFVIWDKFIGVLNRIWNDQNWSIKWSENIPLTAGKETPQEYLERDYPIHGSLESYFKSIVTPTKEKDPNAVLAHKPYFIPTRMEGEEIVIDDTQLVKPVATIYGSEQVIDFLDGEYALIELKEKSTVKHGNTDEKSGIIYEFYDRDNIWRIVQTGRKLDYKFDYFVYWPHGLGYLPVRKLKGKPIQKERDILYQSHFMSAIEQMDEVLLDSSYLRIIKSGHAFPHKWEYVDECDYKNDWSECINGKVLNEEGAQHECPQCHGTGKSKPSSPLGVYQLRLPNQNGTGGHPDTPSPAFGWESPDPTIMEFLRKEISYNEDKALSILNLKVSNSEVKGSDTATGMGIDREELFSFIQSISSQIFDLFGFSIKCTLQMRYSKLEIPALSEPKNFSIRNESDLTEEIAKAVELDLPEIAIQKLLREYLITRFNATEDTRLIDLVFYVDRLVSLNALDLSQKKLSGAVANWEDILHTSIYTFIAEAVNEDPEFFDKPINDQKKVLVDKAKAKDTEIAPKKLNADNILANIDAEIE